MSATLFDTDTVPPVRMLELFAGSRSIGRAAHQLRMEVLSTDIWTNCDLWTPRPMCRNGDTCHEAAPRGSKTGTQGRGDAHERAKIPSALCVDIMEAALRQVVLNADQKLVLRS